MAAQYAHTILKSSEDDLGKLVMRVERLIRHKQHFIQELNTIKSRLHDLQSEVKSLKLTIEGFKFRLSIKEVKEFHQTLKKHSQLCANFSEESDSRKDSIYTTQLDELDMSLREQLYILKGQKPNAGVEGPHANGVGTHLENMFGYVIERLVHTDRPEGHRASELGHRASELFVNLYGCVEGPMNNKVHFKIEVGNIKSRLDGLNPLQVKYIEKIDDFKEGLHFSITEIDDYKEVLSDAKKICEDFSREDNSVQTSAFTKKLYKVKNDLKEQMENLTAKKRKAGLLSVLVKKMI